MTHAPSGKPNRPLLRHLTRVVLILVPLLLGVLTAITVAVQPHSQPALLAVLRAVHPRPASLMGLKLRPRTRAWVGLVLGVSEATPLVAG